METRDVAVLLQLAKTSSPKGYEKLSFHTAENFVHRTHSMQNYQRQVSLNQWSQRLLPSPQWSPDDQRTGASSTDIAHRQVPVTVELWEEFPRWIGEWGMEMRRHGLEGALFEAYAGQQTRHYTTGMLFPEIISNEIDVGVSFRDFFNMVNDFNRSFYPILEPILPPIRPTTRVYAPPTVALNVISNPDVVITDGSYTMQKVGLGEIKTPWVVKRANITSFMRRLPITHFGVQFVAHFTNPTYADRDMLNVGKGLTQIYSDLLTDGLSLGFLATTDSLILCFVPPEDRTSLKVYFHPIYREEYTEEGWGIHTVQVSLITLAWIAKTRYSAHQRHPAGRLWYSFIYKPPEENQDPSYGPKSRRSIPRGPSNLRQSHYPVVNGRRYQYCTPLCLKALRSNRFHPNCPNAKEHQIADANVHSTLREVKIALRYADVELLGGGGSARCVAVRTNQAYTLVIKAFEAMAAKSAFDNEIKLYNHLSKLQGVYIPYIIASGVAVFNGAARSIIVMSYGGVPLDKCKPKDSVAVAENLCKAFTAMSKRDVCHDDIAPRNILVNEHNNKVAIIDFESAGIYPGAMELEEYVRMAEEGVKNVEASGKILHFLPNEEDREVVIL